MKIKGLWISNVLSFKYHPHISDCQELKLDEGVNILIGQNGAGKSTVLEVINFICKRVLFRSALINESNYYNRATLDAYQVRQIIVAPVHNYAGELRLDPNWNTETDVQTIKVKVQLDEVDRANLVLLHQYKSQLGSIARQFSENPDQHITNLDFQTYDEEISFEVQMRNHGVQFHQKTFFVQTAQDANAGYLYLVKYNYFKGLIDLYNRQNSQIPIETLTDPFTIISGYRNYSAFNSQVSLRDTDAIQQIHSVRSSEYSKSLNSIENAEPSIFSLVRLLIANAHFNVFGNGITETEAERIANEQPFMVSINQKLKLVNLKVRISLLDKRQWSYTFTFTDTKRNKVLSDINSLSAGQKAIVHLVFEAYGRGALKGGVIVIDEPEIHLHYQFQHEYLRIIEELNQEQRSQYILVTHSEALINSSTIGKVKRFALDVDGSTRMTSPQLSGNQRTLIKILDNTRSTYAFFGKKVLLVEGDTDRYFFKAVLQQIHPELVQEITILDIGGKGNYHRWKDFFEAFGLDLYFIGDFDNVFSLSVNGTTIISKADKTAAEERIKQTKLDRITLRQQADLAHMHTTLMGDINFLVRPQRALWKPLIDMFINLVKVSNQELVREVRATNTGIDALIDNYYPHKVYLLKRGSIEEYTGTSHGDLDEIIQFCELQLTTWLATSDAVEVKHIIHNITRL